MHCREGGSLSSSSPPFATMACSFGVCLVPTTTVAIDILHRLPNKTSRTRLRWEAITA